MSRVTDYFNTLERQAPGCLEDEGTTISTVGFLAGLLEFGLHYKWGTPAGTVTSIATVIGSFGLKLGISKHTAEHPLPVTLPLFRVAGDKLPKIEPFIDSAGALMLSGIILIPSMDLDVMTNNPNKIASAFICGSAVVLGLGGMLGGEELADRKIAKSLAEELTNTPVSDTIGQLSLFEQEF